MIKNWLITGDTHGQTHSRLLTIDEEYVPEETAIVILGDAGFNFYLNNSEKKRKQICEDFGYTIYVLRGNHEERPENLNFSIVYDLDVEGEVYIEYDFPHIKYLMDGGIYKFGNYSILCIGGAYSVDKQYRIENYTQSNGWSGWFKDEQLSREEQKNILNKIYNYSFDFVLTHTCPTSFEPTDLFLPFIDQNSVDKSTEKFLEIVKNNINWKIWLFGHFHKDRIEQEGVEQFFHNVENINDIYNRWRGVKWDYEE